MLPFCLSFNLEDCFCILNQNQADAPELRKWIIIFLTIKYFFLESCNKLICNEEIFALIKK